MNWNQVEGICMQFRGRVREQWGQLTHRHLEVVKGKREQMVGLLQRRYGAAESHGDTALSALETQAETS